MKKRLAIYPGSFNPFHKGHLDILLKAEDLFDFVIVAIGTNPEKNSDEKFDRLKTLQHQLPLNTVEQFSGFLVDYIHEKEEQGYDVTIVRGLRNGADLDYEVNQLRVMKDQKPDVKIVFIPCDGRFEHISSSMIRNMEKIQEGSGSEYIVKPEMFDERNEIFAPRLKMSGRYNYPKLIENYDLVKVKSYFLEMIDNPEKNYDHSIIEWIKKSLEEENYIDLVFNHLHPILREDFLKEECKIEIKISTDLNDASVAKHILDWTKMHQKATEEKDEWVEFNYIPGYKFKNVKFIPSESEEENLDSLSFTLKYEQIEKL